MIVLMDFLSSLVVLVFTVLYIINGELSMLAIYIFVISLTAISSFFSPSMSAIIPDIVPKNELADANSVREMSNSVLSLASPLVAGLLFGCFRTPACNDYRCSKLLHFGDQRNVYQNTKRKHIKKRRKRALF